MFQSQKHLKPARQFTSLSKQPMSKKIVLELPGVRKGGSFGYGGAGQPSSISNINFPARHTTFSDASLYIMTRVRRPILHTIYRYFGRVEHHIFHSRQHLCCEAAKQDKSWEETTSREKKAVRDIRIVLEAASVQHAARHRKHLTVQDIDLDILSEPTDEQWKDVHNSILVDTFIMIRKALRVEYPWSKSRLRRQHLLSWMSGGFLGN
ncbi:uncharacterized protein EV422DRAFT_130336 [Fimicolochytrium jonesii]|uniref:uncharacterized protein n=1 Tax=Fimicolochytrium jonesii TaxID=1396493 RepID=UPI0022FE8F29|nr:uncharacterized protein EV422DRAFT_130336 [Fimicolochytrium jonesii]KAI8819024.1 hypothetical protein EV422DRAFT_130336 [Fimicolochytrium jonesii]